MSVCVLGAYVLCIGGRNDRNEIECFVYMHCTCVYVCLCISYFIKGLFGLFFRKFEVNDNDE